MIPIPSAITSSALENLPGTNDCHISSKTAKHKQIIEILIIFLIDLLLKLLTLKNPNIEYSIISSYTLIRGKVGERLKPVVC